MKKKEKNSILINKGKPLFKVLGLIALLLSILIFMEIRKDKEIDTHGIDSIGIINYCEYVSFIDNAKSQTRVSFYRIRVDYQYGEKKYSSTIELLPHEYADKIGKKLHKGDEIPIRHSILNPNNFIIKEIEK